MPTSKAVRGIYRLAGMDVVVQSLYEDVHYLRHGYKSTGEACFSVTTTQPDIDFERAKSTQEDRTEGRAMQTFSDAYLENLVVCRKIAEKLPEYDAFLFHGSAIAVDGAAYIFTAKSGTGKSTHARLWREMLGDRAVMVNDDKPLIRVRSNGTATVYGTPWDGKHHLSSNIAVPVQAICILERAQENRIREITKAEALPMLLQQTYRPPIPQRWPKPSR